MAISPIKLKALFDDHSLLISDERIFVKGKIPVKKLRNAVKSYAPNVSMENVLVLIDDTAFGGAKEGLIVARDGLYSKELFASPKSVKLQDVKKLVLRDKSLEINNDEFISFVQPPSDDLKPLLRWLKESMNEGESVKQKQTKEAEGLEQEFLSCFKSGGENFFKDRGQELRSAQKLQSFGSHFGAMFDQLFAVSYEQKNDAHRRDPFQENDASRKIVNVIDGHLEGPVNFHAYLNKVKLLPSPYTSIFTTEAVVFEVYAYWSSRFLLILQEKMPKEAAEAIYLAVVMQAVIFPYAQLKENHRGEINQEFVRTSDVLWEFKNRVQQYGRLAVNSNSDKEKNLCDLLKRHLYRALIMGEAARNLPLEMDEKEQLFEEAFKEVYDVKLTSALKGYLPLVDRSIDLNLKKILL